MDWTQVRSTGEQCHPGIIIAILLILSVTVQPVIAGQTVENPSSIKLPEPRTDNGTSVEQALRLVDQRMGKADVRRRTPAPGRGPARPNPAGACAAVRSRPTPTVGKPACTELASVSSSPAHLQSST